jgi:hypothetical protein
MFHCVIGFVEDDSDSEGRCRFCQRVHRGSARSSLRVAVDVQVEVINIVALAWAEGEESNEGS